MNGQEHYREAERLLVVAESGMRSEWIEDVDAENNRQYVALQINAAQVHATLALFDQVREIGDQLDTLPRSGGQS